VSDHEARSGVLEGADLDGRLAAIEADYSTEGVDASLLDLPGYPSVDTGTADVVFTGANLSIRSGGGATDDGGSLTVLGHLIRRRHQWRSQRGVLVGHGR
jgi:hypothetical protein